MGRCSMACLETRIDLLGYQLQIRRTAAEVDAHFDAQDDAQEFLVATNVSLSFDIERVGFADAANFECNVEQSPAKELAEVHETGGCCILILAGRRRLMDGPRAFRQGDHFWQWAGW